MPREIRPRAEWRFVLKGTLASYLRPESIRKVTLEQIDGLKRRVQTSYGVTDKKLKEAIASCIESSPNCDAARADEIKRKYLN
jgi:hypothetical protein